MTDEEHAGDYRLSAAQRRGLLAGVDAGAVERFLSALSHESRALWLNHLLSQGDGAVSNPLPSDFARLTPALKSLYGRIWDGLREKLSEQPGLVPRDSFKPSRADVRKPIWVAVVDSLPHDDATAAISLRRQHRDEAIAILDGPHAKRSLALAAILVQQLRLDGDIDSPAEEMRFIILEGAARTFPQPRAWQGIEARDDDRRTAFLARLRSAVPRDVPPFGVRPAQLIEFGGVPSSSDEGVEVPPWHPDWPL